MTLDLTTHFLGVSVRSCRTSSGDHKIMNAEHAKKKLLNVQKMSRMSVTVGLIFC